MPAKPSSQAPETLDEILRGDSQSQRNQDDILPHYSDNPSSNGSSTSRWNQQLLAPPGLPNVNILAYLPANAALSSDHMTVTVRDEQLVTASAALASFILAQAALPPRPILRIKCTISGEPRWALKIDMMRYFVRKKDEQAWNFVRIVARNDLASRGESSVSTEPHCDTLLEWAQRFVESPASNKAFVLKRELQNWNTKLLERRIRTLIASLVGDQHLDQMEKVSVSFSATHTQVVVLPQTGAVRRLFSILSPTKKFDVVRAVWPYANTDSEQMDGFPRKCAVQSEDEWWQEWYPVIAMALITKKDGWLTTEDVMDMAMCSKKQWPK